jgi:hypothetical protein
VDARPFGIAFITRSRLARRTFEGVHQHFGLSVGRHIPVSALAAGTAAAWIRSLNL